MDIVHTHCAGLDVHKKTVVACVIIPNASGGWQKEIRTFETMTADLLMLSDWLQGFGVTHVAMESTGEYWKPVFNILEGNFEVVLVNAQHIKAVPGRKTDVKDAECRSVSGDADLWNIPNVPSRDCNMGWCAAALFRRNPNANCGS
jgi:transposase